MLHFAISALAHSHRAPWSSRARFSTFEGSHDLLREVFDGSNRINELLEIQFRIGVQIHSSYDCHQKVVSWDDAALDEKSLQINLIDVLIIPVIDTLEKVRQAVVISTRELLFQILLFTCKFQLFTD